MKMTMNRREEMLPKERTNIEMAIWQGFDILIEYRAFNEVALRMEKNERCQQAEEEYRKVYDAVRDAIGEEHWDIASELESTTNTLISNALEFAYRLGLEDSPKVHREVGRYGIHVAEEGQLKEEAQ